MPPPAAIVWVATGLNRDMTGIERLVINSAKSVDRMSDIPQYVLADRGAVWPEQCAKVAEIVSSPRQVGGVARAPRLPEAAVRADRLAVHSFAPPLPPRMPAGAAASYTVNDWAPLLDRSMPAKARLSWATAMVRGLKRAGTVHFLAPATYPETPPALRPLLRGKPVLTGLPYRPEMRPRVAGIREANLVLCVGSNVPRKRFDVVAAACRRLPEVLFVAVGQGTEVFNESEALGQRGLGRVSEACLQRLYGRASMLVLASSYEGLGLPVLEAWEAGCRILISRAVATRLPEEISRTAIVVPTEAGAQALSDAIAQNIARPIPETEALAGPRVTLVESIVTRLGRVSP